MTQHDADVLACVIHKLLIIKINDANDADDAEMQTLSNRGKSMNLGQPTTCRTCGAPIVFLRTEKADLCFVRKVCRFAMKGLPLGLQETTSGFAERSPGVDERATSYPCLRHRTACYLPKWSSCLTAQNFSYAKFRVMPSRTYSKLTQSEYEAQTTFHNHGPSNDALCASEEVHRGLKCMSGLRGALKTGAPLPEQT